MLHILREFNNNQNFLADYSSKAVFQVSDYNMTLDLLEFHAILLR